MDWLYLLRLFVISLFATVFYSLLLHTPPKAIPVSALVGALGYITYIVICNYGNKIAAYFLATLFMATAGEVLARIIKMPSTIFIIPSIVPLVPGYGLYQTMLMLVLDRKSEAMEICIETVFAALSMAVAMAVVNFVAKMIFSDKRKKIKS